MSSLKKRLLVIVGGLALALIMGAVNDAPNIEAESAANAHDSSLQIADHEEGHGGGGG